MAENDLLNQESQLLREELRIKDVRMAKLDTPRRPHYPPAELVQRLSVTHLVSDGRVPSRSQMPNLHSFGSQITIIAGRRRMSFTQREYALKPATWSRVAL